MMYCFKGGVSEVCQSNSQNTQTACYINMSEAFEGNIPRISKVIQSLRHYDVFKYCAYRTAFKLRILQKASKLHMINLTTIRNVLKQYEINERSVQDKVTVDNLEKLLTSLYTETSKTIGFIEEPSSMAQLFLSFLQTVFSVNDESLLCLQVKVALALFSSAKLSEKHKYFFYICSSDSYISRQNLHLLLESLAKLAEVVGEQLTFGSHHVPLAVKNCVKYCKGKITEKKFLKWLSLEPQTIVWLSTLHRVSVSETISHFITCDNCHLSPIVGLRYRCLHCIRYNMCQNCFLSGLSSKGHKVKHDVHEYCRPASTWEETKSTFAAIKNKVSFVRCPAKAYLSFDDESIFDSIRESSPALKQSVTQVESVLKETDSQLLKELASIIEKLEEENRQMATVVRNLSTSGSSGSHDTGISEDGSIQMATLNKREALLSHKYNLEIQLHRLKELFGSFKTSNENTSPKKETGIVSPVPHVPFDKADHYFESTPINVAQLHLQKHQAKTPINNHYESTSANTEHFTEYNSNYDTSLDLTAAAENSNTNSIEELRGKGTIFSNSTSLSMTNLLSHESAPDYSEPYCNSSAPSSNAANFSSISNQKLFDFSKESSLEAMETELQAMLDQLEKLLPHISSIPNDSQGERSKILSTLTEMEEAVKKLTHLSIETSAGSTDL